MTVILDNLHGMTQVERMFDMASVVLFAVTIVERMFDTDTVEMCWPGLHRFKTLPRPGDGLSLLGSGKGLGSPYRAGGGSLVLLAPLSTSSLS
jgi:hypothetical protein